MNPELTIRQYQHTSWTYEKGTPLPPVNKLAQSADGYLWLGTKEGLWRFDGMNFVNWMPFGGETLPKDEFVEVHSDHFGGLWVSGYQRRYLVKGGRVVRTPALDKLPCKSILPFAFDDKLTIWMTGTCGEDNAIIRLTGDGSVKMFGAADGIPRKLHTVFLDRKGEFWLAAPNGLCRWSPGRQAECFQTISLEFAALMDDCAGNLLIVDPIQHQSFRFQNGRLEPFGPRLGNVSFPRYAVLRDRDNNVWIGTPSEGLLRVRNGKVEQFGVKDGLSGNAIHSLAEDSEGDLWVATARGIDRFRDPKFLRYTTETGLSGDVVSNVIGGRSGVWIGTSGAGLNLLSGDSIRNVPSTLKRARATVSSLYEDGDGRIWTGTSEGLMVRKGGNPTEVLTSDGKHLQRAFNISGDSKGAVWVLDTREGLALVRGTKAYVEPTTFADPKNIYRLLVTRDGEQWVGYYTGGVAVRKDGVIKQYGEKEGLPGGPVLVIYEDRAGTIWVGTRKGLSRLEHGRWRTWSEPAALLNGSVDGIVDDDRGGLWLLTSAGVVRFDVASLNQSPILPEPFFFGRSDGVQATGGGSATPQLGRGRDGRIWAATHDGVAVFNPARLHRNPVAPPVVVEQVTVDAKPFDPALQEIRFRGNDVQIAYAAVSLMVPEQVHFKYRLNGLDHAWTDAGTRRSVAYGHLSPGHYRFQVIAANSDGVWNEKGAEIKLVVEPYFYQTAWFAAACIGFALLAMWSGHRLRVRRVVARYELIAAERARFSRELHDSLLQGFSGVVFLLEAAVRQFDNAPEKSKKGLTKALDQADNSLREARQLITSMRIPALDNHTLPEALRSTASQVVSGMDVDFQFEVRGSVKQGHYDMEANLFLIGREALTNALSHSSAHRIRLTLDYASKDLTLTVQDNGTGFDPEIARVKSGHQGFRGMEERAHQIGAEFLVDSAAGKGTTIEVRVPWKKG